MTIWTFVSYQRIRIAELESRVATLEDFETRYEEQSKFVRQLVREVRYGRDRLAECRQTIEQLQQNQAAERLRNSKMMRRAGRQLAWDLESWVQFGRAMEESNPRPVANPGNNGGGSNDQGGHDSITPGQGGQ